MSALTGSPIAMMLFIAGLTVLDGIFGVGLFFSGFLILGAVLFAYNNGYLEVWQLAMSGVVGAMIADNAGFHLGRRAKVLGRTLPFKETTVDRFYAFLERLGGWDILVVIFGRSFAYTRPIAPFMVGFTGTASRKYLWMSFVSAVLWVGAWLAIAVFGSEGIDALMAREK